MIEDSAVACTDEAKTQLEKDGAHCVIGDGHGIVKATASGKRKVVALSDNVFYERKVEGGGKPHAALDGLYQADLIAKVYGDFDPAPVNASILLEVVKGASDLVDATRDVPLFRPDGGPNDAFDAVAFSAAASVGRKVAKDIVGQRYAEKGERIPLPPVPGGGSSDNADGVGEKGDGGGGGCSASGAAAGGAPIALLAAWMLGLALRRRRR
jgi:uncharacterized protein (TIGR03382 family)